MTTTDEQAKADIDRDPMWRRAYMDVQAVLDNALGTEEADGMGQGIASDVWLLAHQRDEARAKLATIAALCREHPRTLTAEDVLRITGTGEESERD